MNMNSESDVVTIPCHQSVDGTVTKLEQILQAKGVKLFTTIDHSGEAEKPGLQMIFGNPKASLDDRVSQHRNRSSPQDPRLGGRCGQGGGISCNDPSYLQARHGLPPNLLRNIAVVRTLAAKVAE